MPRYQDQVFDEYKRPVEGAAIHVFTPAGDIVALTDDSGLVLANPVLTDHDGIFYFNAPDGEYELEVRFSGQLEYREIIRLGVAGSGVINTADIVDNAVTMPKLADVASPTILGRISTGDGDPEVLNGGQVTTMLSVFSTVAKGLVPPSGGGSTFLRADGNWATPATDVGAVAWGAITGTLSAQADLTAALNGKASTSHTHSITDVTGLQSALDAKLDDSQLGAANGVASLDATGKLPSAQAPATSTLWGTIGGTLASQSDLDAALGAKAPLASPALTGNPTAPTQAALNSTTRIASTAFVQQERAPRIQTAGSNSVTPTFNDDLVRRSAATAGITLNNPTGTAVDGHGIVVELKDNGTARAIAFGSQYRAVGVILPVSTVAGKILELGMFYSAPDTKWNVVSVAQEA